MARETGEEFRESGETPRVLAGERRGYLFFPSRRGSADTKKKNQYFLGPYLGQKNFSILMLARLGSGSQRDVIWLLEPESLLAHTAKMTQSFSGWGSPTPPPSHLLHFCLLLHLLGYTSLGTVLSLLSLQMTLFILSAQQSKFPLTLILCAD